MTSAAPVTGYWACVAVAAAAHPACPCEQRSVAHQKRALRPATAGADGAAHAVAGLVDTHASGCVREHISKPISHGLLLPTNWRASSSCSTWSPGHATSPSGPAATDRSAVGKAQPVCLPVARRALISLGDRQAHYVLKASQRAQTTDRTIGLHRPRCPLAAQPGPAARLTGGAAWPQPRPDPMPNAFQPAQA